MRSPGLHARHRAARRQLDKVLSNEAANKFPIVQPVKSAPYFAWAQYGDPDKVLAMAEPAGAPPYVMAMWHYARGEALAAKKDAAGARNEADAIAKIAKETDWSTLDLWAIPARPVLEVAQNIVLARAAQAENKADDEIGLWKKAAVAQDTIPYTEPPYWYYPVRQSLGSALLRAGRSEEAEKEFLAALDRTRGSAWALFGLEQAEKAKGDAAAADKAAAEFAKAWRGEPSMLSLERL
jgi:tetratricopeptide (TPR) repeat protein